MPGDVPGPALGHERDEVSSAAGHLRLVHLVWAPLGPERLARFLECHTRRDPGTAHRLLIVLNGFRRDDDLGPWRRLLAHVEHDELRLPDPVLDLDAYREAVERVPAQRYCFVNSYSEPLADGWLAKLADALAQPGVGLVGATASWASTRSLMTHFLRLPSAYRGLLPEPGLAISQFMELEADRPGGAPIARHRSRRARTRARMLTLAAVPGRTVPYERFPAYHIRTNVCMIRGSTFTDLRLRPVRDKQNAYQLENGRQSITRQVQRKGLRTLVVDRNGAVFEPGEWPRSRTFWQGDQEGLLVSDNQTRYYDQADPARRRLLSSFAWGRAADPAPR